MPSELKFRNVLATVLEHWGNKSPYCVFFAEAMSVFFILQTFEENDAADQLIVKTWIIMPWLLAVNIHYVVYRLVHRSNLTTKWNLSKSQYFISHASYSPPFQTQVCNAD